MVSVAGIVGLFVIVGVNTALASLATRFFRVRMSTRLGSALYAILLTPLPMVAVVLVLSGALGFGPDLGGTYAVLGLTVVLPLALGTAFDFFWMPSPDEVDVPERRGQGS